MKLQKYYVIVFFSLRLARLALEMENNLQDITQPSDQKTKNEVTKICNEPDKKKMKFNETNIPEIQ